MSAEPSAVTPACQPYPGLRPFLADEAHLYFGRENPFVTPTARVMFTLDYAGLGDRSSVLDGGLDAWVKAGHPLSTDVPPDRTGTLGPMAVQPLIVDAEFVKTNLETRQIAIFFSKMPASLYNAGY